jgi:hypothetical protein
MGVQGATGASGPQGPAGVGALGVYANTPPPAGSGLIRMGTVIGVDALGSMTMWSDTNQCAYMLKAAPGGFQADGGYVNGGWQAMPLNIVNGIYYSNGGCSGQAWISAAAPTLGCVSIYSWNGGLYSNSNANVRPVWPLLFVNATGVSFPPPINSFLTVVSGSLTCTTNFTVPNVTLQAMQRNPLISPFEGGAMTVQ